MQITRLFPLVLALLFVGCASRRELPKYERPLARAQFQTVRTTAYTHTESDHRQYSDYNAVGTRLRIGALNSASCDWSRWPAGTVFQIRETGERFIVDDYGWALAGTNTIDLYKPSRRAMNTWGVRRVHLELLHWGDVRRSLAILRPRSKHRHVRRMVDQIKDRYAELSRPLEFVAADFSEAMPEPMFAAEGPVAEPALVPRAVLVKLAPAPSSGDAVSPGGRMALKPFHSSGAQ